MPGMCLGPKNAVCHFYQLLQPCIDSIAILEIFWYENILKNIYLINKIITYQNVSKIAMLSIQAAIIDNWPDVCVQYVPSKMNWKLNELRHWDASCPQY